MSYISSSINFTTKPQSQNGPTKTAWKPLHCPTESTHQSATTRWGLAAFYQKLEWGSIVLPFSPTSFGMMFLRGRCRTAHRAGLGAERRIRIRAQQSSSSLNRASERACERAGCRWLLFTTDDDDCSFYQPSRALLETQPNDTTTNDRYK